MAVKWWAFLTVGLISTAVEFAWLGSEDVNGALTYAGRLTGVALLCAALLELVAAAVLADCRDSRTPFQYSPAMVLLGVLASLFVNLGLLVLQVESWSYSHYLWVWLLLTLWSVQALRLLHAQHKAKAFDIPRAKAIVIGASVTGLISIANFGYTQIYQPYMTPAEIATTVELGSAQVKGGVVTVPVRVTSKNIGNVGVYALGSLYQLTAGRAVYTDKARTIGDWQHAINDGQTDLFRYEDEANRGYELLAQGRIMQQGHKLDPGMEVASEKIVQFPLANSYDTLNASGDVVFMRTDRAALVSDVYAQSGRSSWHKDNSQASERHAPGWVAQKDTKTFQYRSPITHSNALLEYTRSTRYVTLWWALEEPRKTWVGPYLVATVAAEDDEN